MDIHSGLALGSVFVGAALFGPIGALIGIPLAAAVIAVIETYGQRYELVPELVARAARDGLRVSTGGGGAGRARTRRSWTRLREQGSRSPRRGVEEP